MVPFATYKWSPLGLRPVLAEEPEQERTTTTWNVLTPGSAPPLDVLTVSAAFTWNVLGIPHSDFHIFDGSVVPGYVDGVVTILEEPNPFCDKCGWF